MKIFENLTNFEHVAAKNLAPNSFQLDRMIRLVNSAGNPERSFLTIHISGTKGKGSTAAMLMTILQETGFKTGLYTSPSLHSVCERIMFNGLKISPDELAAEEAELQQIIENMGDDLPTYFEALTTLAFRYFAKHGVEIGIIETGLGGTSDATNVVQPKIAVITSISLDHTAILGKTLTEIARHKAGIIKPGVAVISAPQPIEVEQVIREECRLKEAICLHFSHENECKRVSADLDGQIFSCSNAEFRTYQTPLLGDHQLENAAVVLSVISELRRTGLQIPESALQDGFKNVCWPGRFQVLSREPVIVADGAHNRYSAAVLRNSLQSMFGNRKVVFVLGMSVDKDIAGVIEELIPLSKNFVLTRSNHPRAADPNILSKEFQLKGVQATEATTVEQAIIRAKELVVDDDRIICVTGSLFIVAEAIRYMLMKNEQN